MKAIDQINRQMEVAEAFGAPLDEVFSEGASTCKAIEAAMQRSTSNARIGICALTMALLHTLARQSADENAIVADTAHATIDIFYALVGDKLEAIAKRAREERQS